MKTTLIKLCALLLCLALLPLYACGNHMTETEAVRETAPPAESENAVTTPEEATEETEDDGRDTRAPFFLKSASRVTVEQGKEFDLHRYISYVDDLDADVDLTVEGDVDVKTAGDYPLSVTITDNAGNAASLQMTVTVAEKLPDNAGSKLPAPKSFGEFSARYKTDETMVGIDVSRWQGEINFNKVAAAGCEFVIIRLGGYSDGLFEDRYFKQNLKNAKEAGLKVGVYWYSEENSADMVRQDAVYLYDLLDGAELDFPVFFDWEDYSHFEDYKMSIRDLNDMFRAFREEAEERGYQAALYNSRYYLDLLWQDEITDHSVWMACYTDRTAYEGNYFMWQQGFGRIDGISGDVDVDVFYPEKMAAACLAGKR